MQYAKNSQLRTTKQCSATPASFGGIMHALLLRAIAVALSGNAANKRCGYEALIPLRCATAAPNRSKWLCEFFKLCVQASAVIQLRRLETKGAERLDQHDYGTLLAIQSCIQGESIS